MQKKVAIFLILLFGLIFNFNKMDASPTGNKFQLILVFDSTFNSVLFKVKSLSHRGSSIILKEPSDTIQSDYSYHFYDLNPGDYVINISSQFHESQSIKFKLNKDTFLFIKNKWFYVDSIIENELRTADSVEFFYRSQGCMGTQIIENKYLLIKTVTNYRLIQMNIEEPIVFPDVTNFTKTIFKSEDGKATANNEDTGRLVSFDIIKDLYFMQKKIQQSIEYGKLQQLRSSGNNGQLYIKVGNKIIAYEPIYETDWGYYNGFEKKYLK